MAKSFTTSAPKLSDSEARLKAALDRLVKVVKSKQESGSATNKLEAENKKLQDQFENLKKEYDTLEKSFTELKETMKKAPTAESKEAAKSNEETEFLKKELERVHKEYKTLDLSFRKLREEYNDLKDTEPEKAEGDLLSNPPGEEKGEKDKAAAELKKDLGTRMDKTISALEKLVG